MKNSGVHTEVDVAVDARVFSALMKFRALAALASTLAVLAMPDSSDAQRRRRRRGNAPTDQTTTTSANSETDSTQTSTTTATTDTATPAQQAAPAAPRDLGPQRELIELGRRQYEDLHYEETLQTLSAALIRRGNTLAAEVAIYELLGLSYLSLNRNDEADGAFRLLLAREGTHELSPDNPPRFIEFYNSVRQRWIAEAAANPTPTSGSALPAAAADVTIEHRSPAEQARSRAVTLDARVTDPRRRVARLVLAYRAGSRGLFTRADAVASPEPGGPHRATIPSEAVRPPIVEYYFEAVDTNGVPVQSRGDAFAPLRISVPQPGGLPWWAFVGGGVLIVGAAAGIAAGYILSQPPQMMMPPPNARVTIEVVGQ